MVISTIAVSLMVLVSMSKSETPMLKAYEFLRHMVLIVFSFIVILPVWNVLWISLDGEGRLVPTNLFPADFTDLR